MSETNFQVARLTGWATSTYGVSVNVLPSFLSLLFVRLKPCLSLAEDHDVNKVCMITWMNRDHGRFNPTSHKVKEDPQSHRGGAIMTTGKKNIFPSSFLAVSLHISILLYIRTSHSRGNVSSFKTLDLGAFQKSNPKAQKSLASKFIKEKLKKMRGRFSFEGHQT